MIEVGGDGDGAAAGACDAPPEGSRKRKLRGDATLRVRVRRAAVMPESRAPPGGTAQTACVRAVWDAPGHSGFLTFATLFRLPRSAVAAVASDAAALRAT